MDATVFYEPEFDKTYTAPEPDASPPYGEWKLLCRDDGVSILAPKEGQLVLVGSGRWTGKHIKERYVVSSESTPISNSRWARFEHALDRAATGIHETKYAKVSDGTPVPDARNEHWSGWAVATCLVMMGGTLVAWIAEQPGDALGHGLVVGLGLTTMLLVLYCAAGWLTECPRCGSWNCRTTTKPTVDEARYAHRCTECAHHWTGTTSWR